MIEVSNLTKSFKRKVVVNDASFTVKTGKVTGFLGPNGAGKSTTMRLMLGLYVGKGTTKYDGKYLYEYESPSSVVGVLLEAKAFHPKRTARNHLLILANAGNIPHSRVDEVLDIVGLSSVADKRPGKFSLGMSQRLGIAAALLGEPKYLLLDEPANGLDPEGIAWLRGFMKDYASAGNGVLISSHLLSEIALMADNVVVIGKGNIIANTSIKSLLAGNKHASVYVRVSSVKPFQKVLKEHKLTSKKEGAGLIIQGTTTDKVGKMAADAGVAVLELSTHTATLEDAYLDLTAGTEEYHSKGGNS